MRKKLAFSTLLVVPLLMIQTARPADELPPANRWIPEQAVLVLEISQPRAFLNPLLSPEFAEAVSALPVYKEAAPKLFPLLMITTVLEKQLGSDWRTILRQVLGGGITFAVGPNREMLVAVDARDAGVLTQLHELVRKFTADAAANRGSNQVSSTSYRGVTRWSFGPNESHAIIGSRLLLANRQTLLNLALDLRADPKAKSIVSSPLYSAARQAVEKGAAATLYLNMQVVMQNPKLRQALTQKSNPLQTLLLAGSADALQKGNWLALGFYVKDDTLTLKLVTDGPPPSGAAAFAAPAGADAGVLPNLEVPRGIAGLSLYRDLRGFYAAKDTLFPERGSGLIFFENMMGIFFSGTDLTEGVLGETKPEIRFVAAAQQYDPAVGTPAIQLPAFAFIFRLRHPEKFGDVVEEAWQKAIGLANFTQGQKALPGLIIDKASVTNAKITFAYYRPQDAEDKTQLDVRCNFRPAVARLGEYVVLSSTDELAKDLVPLLSKEGANSPKPLPNVQTVLEIDGRSLRHILEANREQLARKNMLDKGHSLEQAKRQLNTVFTLLDFLTRSSLSLGLEQSHPQAILQLKLKLPTISP